MLWVQTEEVRQLQESVAGLQDQAGAARSAAESALGRAGAAQQEKQLCEERLEEAYVQADGLRYGMQPDASLQGHACIYVSQGSSCPTAGTMNAHADMLGVIQCRFGQAVQAVQASECIAAAWEHCWSPIPALKLLRALLAWGQRNFLPASRACHMQANDWGVCHVQR